MKPAKLFMLLAAVFLLIYALTTIVFTYARGPLEVQKKDIDVTVGHRVGFDVGTDAFHYGILMPKSSGTRKFDVTNKKNYSQTVVVKFSGDVSDWMAVSENFFTIEPDGKKTIALTMTIPPETTGGNYAGEVLFFFKKAK